MWGALFFADCQSLRSWKRPLALKKQRMDYDTEHKFAPLPTAFLPFCLWFWWESTSRPGASANEVKRQPGTSWFKGHRRFPQRSKGSRCARVGVRGILPPSPQKPQAQPAPGPVREENAVSVWWWNAFSVLVRKHQIKRQKFKRVGIEF